MQLDDYISNLKLKFKRHFHIKTNAQILGENLELVANFSEVSGRTFVTQHDIIDRYENYENCYIKFIDSLITQDVILYTEFLKKIVESTISPSKDHMSTYITGVLLTNNLDEETKALIESFKYNKVYSFYLKGWCDVRLLCVDLSTHEIISNKDGKKIKKIYKCVS